MNNRSPVGRSADCAPAPRTPASEQGRDQWAIARLQTGVVRLNPTQYHPGATFFVAMHCVAELHDLPEDVRIVHLGEMALVAQAVFRCVTPRRMNYEALGNSVPHLHWWLTPRHADDRRPGGPIWEDPDFLRALGSNEARPSDEQRDRLRHRLLTELQGAGAVIERTYV